MFWVILSVMNCITKSTRNINIFSDLALSQFEVWNTGRSNLKNRSMSWDIPISGLSPFFLLYNWITHHTWNCTVALGLSQGDRIPTEKPVALARSQSKSITHLWHGLSLSPTGMPQTSEHPRTSLYTLKILQKFIKDRTSFLVQGKPNIWHNK